MQQIRSSNPPVITGICDPNKSRARHRCSLRLSSKLKYLDIQECIEYINKKHETLTIPLAHVYINRPNTRLVFKIKDGYKLELQTPETMKLFGRTKKNNRQNKKRRKC